MKIKTRVENELITKINKILDDFHDFDKPFLNNNGDIIIQKKTNKIVSKDVSVLTNIFKEIIKNDVKKNRV
tara:strand:+ start:271 stop:483 length:213 start_codon:yes stop_codon:yes gene_type:complete